MVVHNIFWIALVCVNTTGRANMTLEKRGKSMRYLVTIIWAAIFGQVMGFLAGALTQTTYSPLNSLIYSVIFAVLLFIVPVIMKQFAQTEAKAK